MENVRKHLGEVVPVPAVRVERADERHVHPQGYGTEERGARRVVFESAALVGGAAEPHPWSDHDLSIGVLLFLVRVFIVHFQVSRSRSARTHFICHARKVPSLSEPQPDQ